MPDLQFESDRSVNDLKEYWDRNDSVFEMSEKSVGLFGAAWQSEALRKAIRSAVISPSVSLSFVRYLLKSGMHRLLHSKFEADKTDVHWFLAVNGQMRQFKYEFDNIRNRELTQSPYVLIFCLFVDLLC